MTHRGTNAMSHLSVGSHHAGAVHSNGQLYMWGDGSFGRLGLGGLYANLHSVST